MTNGKVFVASKLPHGIRMGPIVLNRPPHWVPGTPRPKPPYEMMGGYAVTEVPSDVWAEWIRAHAQTDMVCNKLVWGEPKHIDIETFCAVNRKASAGAGPARF